MIPENVGNIKQVQPLINELHFDKLCLGGSGGMRGKSLLLNEKAIIILKGRDLTQSYEKKPLQP